MLAAIETAALLNWDVSPYNSLFGKLSEREYTFKTKEWAFRQTINSLYDLVAILNF